ncbi:MAG: transposase family protein [Chloroflexi bacterium]|nr:transposase family protein [Chloroflexota bacterium]
MEATELGQSLMEAFELVPDPRSAHGLRHPLTAILAQSVCAMLSGSRSIYAIFQWGRAQDEHTVKALGFTRNKTPAVSSLHEVFKRLDADAFEAAVAQWSQRYLGSKEAIAVDGKALRGIHGEHLPGVHLVAAYAHELEMVVAQKGGKEERTEDSL